MSVFSIIPKSLNIGSCFSATFQAVLHGDASPAETQQKECRARMVLTKIVLWVNIPDSIGHRALSMFLVAVFYPC